MRHPITAHIESIERPVSVRIAVASPPYGGDIYRLTLDDGGGRGFVSCAAPDWSASYWWPAAHRGTWGDRPSLLGFLLQCDVGYLAGKFGIGHDIDCEATERAIKVELWRGNRRHYRQILREVPPSCDRVRGHEDWLSSFAEWCRWNKVEPAADYERFSLERRIRPDFARLYHAAWPMLRAKRMELEHLLYPEGVPIAVEAA